MRRATRPPKTMVLLIFLFMSMVAAVRAAEPSTTPADTLHRESIVIDGHNEVATWILDYGFDLRMNGADESKRNAEMQYIFGRFLPTPSGAELRTHTDL